MRIRKYLFSALALAAMSVSAQAATIVQVQNFGPATPNFTKDLTFNKFNGPGSLTGISVALKLNVKGGQLTVDNDGNADATVNVALGATGSIESDDVGLVNLTFQPVVGTVTAQTTGTYNLGPDNGDGTGHLDGTFPDGAVMLGQDKSDSKSGFINPLAWSGYIGAGTFDIKAMVNQILNFGSVGGVEGSFSPVTGSGNVTVTYYTTAVPVPAAAFGALPLLGLLAVRRMKKA